MPPLTAPDPQRTLRDAFGLEAGEVLGGDHRGDDLGEEGEELRPALGLGGAGVALEEQRLEALALGLGEVLAVEVDPGARGDGVVAAGHDLLLF